MKAAVLRQFNMPLTIEDVPEPTIDPSSVIIKVEACGLCGTDRKIASGVMQGVRTPLIPGHEVAGRIVEVGKDVTNITSGDNVVVYFYITCGQCFACRQGWDTLCANLVGQVGFHINGGCAEFLKVPAKNVFPISAEIPFEEAAILSDAVATTYHALLKRAKAQAGQTAVLMGVGGLGLHALQIAKVIGLYTIAVDIDQSHLDMAAKLGADVLINPTEDELAESVLNVTRGKGVDIVLEMSGNPEAASGGFPLLAPRGKMILMGYNPTQPFEVSSSLVASKELELYGSRASTRQDLADVIDWVASGKIKPIVQEVMPLSQINEAHEKLKSGKVVGRLVLHP